jgi:hypothetical protein
MDIYDDIKPRGPRNPSRCKRKSRRLADRSAQFSYNTRAAAKTLITKDLEQEFLNSYRRHGNHSAKEYVEWFYSPQDDFEITAGEEYGDYELASELGMGKEEYLAMLREHVAVEKQLEQGIVVEIEVISEQGHSEDKGGEIVEEDWDIISIAEGDLHDWEVINY